jgi:hypothetical protein
MPHTRRNLTWLVPLLVLTSTSSCIPSLGGPTPSLPHTFALPPPWTPTPTRTPHASPDSQSPPEGETRSQMTPSPLPSPEPTLSPSQRPLIVYGIFGGDGGTASDFYLGRGVPDLVLYANGDIIRKVCVDAEACRLLISRIPPSEVCRLRARLIAAGLFSIPDPGPDPSTSPIYNFDETTQYSDGAPSIVIQVNGDPSINVGIYTEYYPYLIRPVRDAERILAQYAPSSASPYRPSTLLLWIEQGRGLASASEIPLDWPAGLPSLRELWQARVLGRGFFGGTDVALDSEIASAVHRLFGERMIGALFTENGILYYLIPRPLLPHETPARFSPHPYGAEAFPFPYDCGE